MTTLTLDLADILEAKLQSGFTLPVSVDVDQLLEYADDDWVHDLDLDALLADRREAAVVVSAAEVRREYPHLTPEQAWEVAVELRDDLAGTVKDILWFVVDKVCPPARAILHDRLRGLRFALQGRSDVAARHLLDRLAGVTWLFHQWQTAVSPDPAVEGLIAATLDDLEAAAAVDGGVA